MYQQQKTGVTQKIQTDDSIIYRERVSLYYICLALIEVCTPISMRFLLAQNNSLKDKECFVLTTYYEQARKKSWL